MLPVRRRHDVNQYQCITREDDIYINWTSGHTAVGIELRGQYHLHSKIHLLRISLRDEDLRTSLLRYRYLPVRVCVQHRYWNQHTTNRIHTARRKQDNLNRDRHDTFEIPTSIVVHYRV